jgi:hypothetical protein
MLFQSSEAVGEEALTPQADHFTAGAQRSSDVLVGHAFGSVEDHLGSLNLKIRQRIFRGTPVQLGLFGRRESNHEWA